MNLRTVLVLSGTTITSAGTATSDAFPTPYGELRGVYYSLATSTTGTYVSATASYLVAVDSSLTYVLPVDSAGAAQNLLLINVNSNNRYIGYRAAAVPVAPWAQVRVQSSTNNTLTLAGLYLVYDEGARQ